MNLATESLAQGQSAEATAKKAAQDLLSIRTEKVNLMKAAGKEQELAESAARARQAKRAPAPTPKKTLGDFMIADAITAKAAKQAAETRRAVPPPIPPAARAARRPPPSSETQPTD